MPAPASATSLRAGNRLGRVRHIADHNSTFACVSLKTSGGVCLHPSFLLAAVLLLHRVGSSGHVRSSPAAHHRSPKVTNSSRCNTNQGFRFHCRDHRPRQSGRRSPKRGNHKNKGLNIIGFDRRRDFAQPARPPIHPTFTPMRGHVPTMPIPFRTIRPPRTGRVGADPQKPMIKNYLTSLALIGGKLCPDRSTATDYLSPTTHPHPATMNLYTPPHA